jgi:hypothetical protein
LETSLNSLVTDTSNLEEINSILNLLFEFNKEDERQLYVTFKTLFLERLSQEYQELMINRKELQKQFLFKEANELHKQIIDIGDFLMKYTSNLGINSHLKQFKNDKKSNINRSS